MNFQPLESEHNSPSSSYGSQDEGGATTSIISNSKNMQASGKTKKQSNTSVSSWILAFIFFASLSWVSLWTILATHTQVQRTVINPALKVKPLYFDQKAGTRVFTYLGVFYVLLGAVSYLALMWDIRLPKPSRKLVRTYRVLPCPNWTTARLSVLEAVAYSIFGAVLLATFLARVFNRFEFGYWPSERYVYEVAKTFGKTAALILMVLLFPVSKNCFWWDIFNYQFERAVKVHRFLAWFLVAIVIIHATTAIASLIMVGQFRNCMWPNENCEKPGGWENWEGLETSRIMTYGWIAVLIAIPLIITSLPWFRRNKFEWFYYTHFLFIPFLVMMHLHYENMIYYTAPGLSAYVLDKVVWWCASRRATRIVDLSIPAPGFCRLTIAVDPGYRFEPGSWVQLKIPAISVLEWHPMSIASAPGHSTIMIDIKVLGDWTKRLAQFAATFDSSRPSHNCVFVDMYHGSSHKQMQGYLNHSAVLMFAGGIGITPMMSSMRHLVESSTDYPDIKRAVLVWCCKKKSVVELYRNELARLQSLGNTASGCDVQVIVHVTLSEKENEKQSESDATDEDSSSHEDDRSNGNSPGPLIQHVMGYSHQLILTMCAGVGCFLGLFLANFISYERDWRPEAVSMLQLAMVLVCSGTLVACAMSWSYFRPNAEWKRNSISLADHEKEKDVEMAQSKQSPDTPDLNVVLGCRPNVDEIIEDMNTYCATSGISSVGVSVCGPDELVESVCDTSRQKSTPSVEFVVDEETFEW